MNRLTAIIVGLLAVIAVLAYLGLPGPMKSSRLTDGADVAAARASDRFTTLAPHYR